MRHWGQKAKAGWNQLSRFTRILLVSTVLLLVGFRLALPSLVERYVNRKLDQLPTYDGRIGEVDIHLFRGAYSINRVDIYKTTGKVPVPFFSASAIDFSVEWRELFHGSIVGEIKVVNGKLNFVKGRTEEESQTHVDKHWTEVVKDLFPFEINRFEFYNSEVWFRDFTTEPKVDIFATQMTLVGTNFSNTRDVSTSLPAGLWLKGKSLGNGELNLKVRLNPFASKPTFDLNAELKNANLVALNEVLRAYAKVDVKKGSISIFSELAAKDGYFEGYVMPLMEDLDIVNLKEDKNLVKVAWEALVAGMVQLFKNHPEDRLGTKIPISGSFDDPQTSIWSAFVNVFRNFLSAFPAHVEGTIGPEDLKDLQKEKVEE